MNFQGIMLGGKKKPVPKGCILYGTVYVTFLNWQNYKP